MQNEYYMYVSLCNVNNDLCRLDGLSPDIPIKGQGVNVRWGEIGPKLPPAMGMTV